MSVLNDFYEKNKFEFSEQELDEIEVEFLEIVSNKFATIFGTFFIIAGFLFWGINHYFPLFSETKKLRNAVKNLSNNFKLTIGITNLTFQ